MAHSGQGKALAMPWCLHVFPPLSLCVWLLDARHDFNGWFFIGVTTGVQYLALVKVKSCLQSQPEHSKTISQILQNNEIGLENKMLLEMTCFICLMGFLHFAAMCSSLPFYAFTVRTTTISLHENKESCPKSSKSEGWNFRTNIVRSIIIHRSE